MKGLKNKEKIKVSVVIPFYQREPKLLLKAVQSVVEQDFSGFIDIIIVDDGSPISARDESQNFKYDQKRISINIIKQINRGVGAARNLGLENVREDTDYIAFLDSDDTWPKNYLKEAFKLGSDFDIFFINGMRYDSDKGFFQVALETSSNSFQSSIELSKGIYSFEGDLLFVTVRCPLFSITSALFNYQKCRNLRFDESLLIGEDTYFLLTFISIAKKVIYSTNMSMIYGKGVNIYYSTRSHHDSTMIRRLYFELMTNFSILAYLKQIGALRCVKLANKGILDSYKTIYDSFFHLLLRPSQMPWFWVWKIVISKPVILFYFPYFLIGSIFRKIKSYRQEDKPKILPDSPAN